MNEDASSATPASGREERDPGERPQVAWKAIEEGAALVSAEGEEVGRVDEIAGDSTADIFNGLAVSPGRLKGSRYVPSERVIEIVEGRVTIDVPSAEFEQLPEYEGVPPSLDILKPDRREDEEV